MEETEREVEDGERTKIQHRLLLKTRAELLQVFVFK